MSNRALQGERGEGGFEPNGTGAVGRAGWSNVSSSKSAHNAYRQKLMLSCLSPCEALAKGYREQGSLVATGR